MGWFCPACWWCKLIRELQSIMILWLIILHKCSMISVVYISWKLKFSRSARTGLSHCGNFATATGTILSLATSWPSAPRRPLTSSAFLTRRKRSSTSSASSTGTLSMSTTTAPWTLTSSATPWPCSPSPMSWSCLLLTISMRMEV